MQNYLKISLFFITILTFSACQEDTSVPKPRGYLRVDFPEKNYQTYDTIAPYIFKFPNYSYIEKDINRVTEPYWINLMFPKFNAEIHLTYKDISGNLAQFEEDTRTLAYKHTIKADAINEKVWENRKENVYGILYEIKGNVASQVQFYLTDSVKHFVRGALYFNVRPNKDSLAPSVVFLRKDIDKMIETFRWKNDF